MHIPAPRSPMVPTVAVPAPALCPAPQLSPHQQHSLVHLFLLQMVFQRHQPERHGTTAPWPWERGRVLYDTGQRDNKRSGGMSAAERLPPPAARGAWGHIPSPRALLCHGAGTGCPMLLLQVSLQEPMAHPYVQAPQRGWGGCAALRLPLEFGLQVQLGSCLGLRGWWQHSGDRSCRGGFAG